ncbi:3-dehydroquinate synthase II [Desulfitobacterium sp. THU1]|uniref:3-dehydroquinate synthase II n=1 Tax=Desulfitobacterium sp. THU1 TaxID=3138072 RepID=UPI00311E6FBF
MEKERDSRREVWFDGRNLPIERQEIWSLINNSIIEKIILTKPQWDEGHYPLKTQAMIEISTREEIDDLSIEATVLSKDQNLLHYAKAKSHKTCVFFDIVGRTALESAWQDAANYDYTLVDFDLPTNIPLELIIARLQQGKTNILKPVSTLTDMEVCFGVMEQGSDGVTFASTDIHEIIKVCDFLQKDTIAKLNLQPLTVTEVRHIGMGLRSCIDTTGLMTQDEGMLIGSTSQGGILVCSETHHLPYMNLRPFRVNAGAVHSYVWMPNNTAEYLTDLAAGSHVLCVNTQGEVRTLSVGRIKTEVRPLLLIKGEAAGKEINVIVQDDWHIRIMGADGKPKNATLINPGDQLLSYVGEPGRHVGIKVNETILEK